VVGMHPIPQFSATIIIAYSINSSTHFQTVNS
jgi:hypothetical protein